MKSKEVFPGVFSRHARAYRDRVMDVVSRRQARGRLAVLEKVAAKPGERILDLACGPGTLTLPVGAAVGPDGRVIGVDLAPGMIELLREAAPANVEARLGDMDHLDFADASFDAVTCGHGLQFVPDLGAALREARRVLRPGGRYVASVPAEGFSGGIREVIGDLLDSVPSAPTVSDRLATVEVLRDPEGWRDAALEAGFARADVSAYEEVVSYPTAADAAARTVSWWDFAWRLEQVTPEARAAIAEAIEERLRERVQRWPLELPGRTHVLYAVK
ncbi:MAG TPA: methyltransferase domain-containing protein [Candidatus Dormibacteraeota bacterium]